MNEVFDQNFSYKITPSIMQAIQAYSQQNKEQTPISTSLADAVGKMVGNVGAQQLTNAVPQQSYTNQELQNRNLGGMVGETVGGTAGSALSGAVAGSIGGPVGTGVGALAGLIASMLGKGLGKAAGSKKGNLLQAMFS